MSTIECNVWGYTVVGIVRVQPTVVTRELVINRL